MLPAEAGLYDTNIGRVVASIAKKAEVEGAEFHRFRKTYAVLIDLDSQSPFRTWPSLSRLVIR